MRLPIEVSADQPGDAGVDVHHRAAGEVERALLPEPAGVAVTASRRLQRR